MPRENLSNTIMYQDALSEMDFLQLDLHEWQGTYTVLHMSRQVLFGAENQGNHQISKTSCYPINMD